MYNSSNRILLINIKNLTFFILLASHICIFFLGADTTGLCALVFVASITYFIQINMSI